MMTAGQRRHPRVPHPDERLRKGASFFHREAKTVNDWAALRLAAAYGAAATIWLFAVYSTLGVVFAGQQVTLLYWSNAAQLVFCPLMVYVGNLLGKTQQAKADADHEALSHIAITLDDILGALRRNGAGSPSYTSGSDDGP